MGATSAKNYRSSSRDARTRPIARDILAHLGIPATPEEEKKIRDGYIALLPKTLPAGKSKLHPGIQEALEGRACASRNSSGFAYWKST